MSKKREPEDSEQKAAFIKAARELGCDEFEEHFDTALRTIAKHKPKEQPTKPRTAKLR